MIIAKCPLRVSLIGGGTDLQDFINEYEVGSVISFPCNLYTYISLFNDVNGFNQNENQYIINYTTREATSRTEDIKNDIARETLKYFNSPPTSVSFNTDVFSSGSGLASSSAYTVALIKALYRRASFHTVGNAEICNKAIEIERKFNPLTGYQDAYGCGIGKFKRMDFHKTQNDTARTVIKNLEDEIFEEYDCYLIYTSINRSSTNVLKSINLEKAKEILPLVDQAENSIKREKPNSLFKIINEAWKLKKLTSEKITSSPELLELDKKLETSKSILCHKLCGAGGGGYFLVFANKGADLAKEINNFEKISFKIKPDNQGAQVVNVSGSVVVM